MPPDEKNVPCLMRAELTTLELLNCMIVRTEIANGKWAAHEGPTVEGDFWVLSVLDMMRLKLGPFAAPRA